MANIWLRGRHEEKLTRLWRNAN